MKIYVLRHPKILESHRKLCYGQTDVPLSKDWKKSIQKWQRKLKTITFDIVYSSPATRCTSVLDSLEYKYKIDSRLKEIHFGDWEMQLWDDIPQKQIESWRHDIENFKIPNGESYKQFSERTSSFLKDLRRQRYSNVLIISHAGVLRSFYIQLQKLLLLQALDRSIPFNSLHIFEVATDDIV